VINGSSSSLASNPGERTSIFEYRTVRAGREDDSTATADSGSQSNPTFDGGQSIQAEFIAIEDAHCDMSSGSQEAGSAFRGS